MRTSENEYTTLDLGLVDVRISDPTVLFNNKLQSIVDKKSKLFYLMLISRQTSAQHMETIFAKEFKFVRSKHILQTIYKQKLCLLKLLN